jgi:ADP-ribose pyrophosphatase
MPMTPHGPWNIVASHEVYRDPWIVLHRDDVIRPDGKSGTFSVVHLKPGVCVLALDEAGCVHLTEEFHYGVGRTTIEAVSGGIEPGEDALLTARRELQEELGIEAEEWHELGTVDPFTSSVVSPTRLFLARQLRFGPQTPEGTELIRRVSVPFAAALQMVMDGRITHAPTCVLILMSRLRFVAE